MRKFLSKDSGCNAPSIVSGQSRLGDLQRYKGQSDAASSCESVSSTSSQLGRSVWADFENLRKQSIQGLEPGAPQLHTHQQSGVRWTSLHHTQGKTYLSCNDQCKIRQGRMNHGYSQAFQIEYHSEDVKTAKKSLMDLSQVHATFTASGKFNPLKLPYHNAFRGNRIKENARCGNVRWWLPAGRHQTCQSNLSKTTIRWNYKLRSQPFISINFLVSLLDWVVPWMHLNALSDCGPTIALPLFSSTEQ